ncbi:MAG: universal stress protein [Gemmatimonadales bacterium]
MEPILILVGTDFSAGARGAYLIARALAGRFDGEVLVVHVIDGAREDSTEFDEDARQWSADCDISHRSIITRRGTPWLELTQEARERDAALIMLGRHGRTGFQSIKLGSTATRVTLAAPCPVMLAGERVAGRAVPRFWHGASARSILS